MLSIHRMIARLVFRRHFRAILGATFVAAAGSLSVIADEPLMMEEFEGVTVEEIVAPPAVANEQVAVEPSEPVETPAEPEIDPPAPEAPAAVEIEEVAEAPATEEVAETPAAVEIEEVVEAPSPFEMTVELYKKLRELQSAEETADDDLYSAAYEVYQSASTAIKDDTLPEEYIDQLKGILMDINDVMARGAVNYSSKGDSPNMTRFSRAYIDTQQLPQMATADFHRDPELYPALVYCAASGSFNAGDVEDAINYFEIYLRTRDTKHREPVSLFYGQSLLKTNQPARGLEAVVEATNEFPANMQLLTIAMQMCIDTHRLDLVAPLVERALALKPDDERLMNLQAQVWEDQQKYRPALDIYLQLEELHPNSLNINECIARCYYNLATTYYNESIMATSDKDISKSRRQSNAYFSSAAEKYEELAENDPNNAKYIKAMASSYAVLGNKSRVDAANVRLTALGASPVAMNDLPALMGDPRGSAEAKAREIPSYQAYAGDYVTREMAKWVEKGEFEKVDDYTQRISPENIRKEQKRLSAITEENYLKEYAGKIMISEMKLQPYDVENETYAINSDFGPVYIKVPLKNQEAELFKNTWERVQISNAKFFVHDDRIAISTITFRTPNGKDYTYNASAALTYEPTVVKVDVDKLIAQAQDHNPPAPSGGQTADRTNVKTITVESDVDKNIPRNKQENDRTIALIIANEDYGKVAKVTSAEHDGDVFAQYCRETLGIPDKQVLLHKNVTYGNILSALNRLKNSVNALGEGVDVIVYYAGHGVPDENSKESYILPVDADPMVMATAYPLAKLYDDLNDMGAANVMVFIDACFSGANRGEGMLADARGVVLQAQPSAPKGSMFVLSAADGNQTALPWKEKNHGLFTYYLLKKLQESKGNASLQEIADYVKSEVGKTASLTLDKPQTPTVTASGALSQELNKKKLRK